MLQVPLALLVLASPELRADRLYAKSPLSWRLVTTTAGYFVYDFYVHRWRSLPPLPHHPQACIHVRCPKILFFLRTCLALRASTEDLQASQEWSLCKWEGSR